MSYLSPLQYSMFLFGDCYKINYRNQLIRVLFLSINLSKTTVSAGSFGGGMKYL